MGAAGEAAAIEQEHFPRFSWDSCHAPCLVLPANAPISQENSPALILDLVLTHSPAGLALARSRGISMLGRDLVGLMKQSQELPETEPRKATKSTESR